MVTNVTLITRDGWMKLHTIPDDQFRRGYVRMAFMPPFRFTDDVDPLATVKSSVLDFVRVGRTTVFEER